MKYKLLFIAFIFISFNSFSQPKDRLSIELFGDSKLSKIDQFKIDDGFLFKMLKLKYVVEDKYNKNESGAFYVAVISYHTIKFWLEFHYNSSCKCFESSLSKRKLLDMMMNNEGKTYIYDTEINSFSSNTAEYLDHGAVNTMHFSNDKLWISNKVEKYVKGRYALGRLVSKKNIFLSVVTR